MNSTTISAVTEHVNGIIEVKFAVVLGGVDINRPHRTAFTPATAAAGAVSAQMQAVNTHCVALGYAEVPQSEIDKITTKASALWTPEVVAAFEANQTV